MTVWEIGRMASMLFSALPWKSDEASGCWGIYDASVQAVYRPQ